MTNKWTYVGDLLLQQVDNFSLSIYNLDMEVNDHPGKTKLPLEYF